MVAAQPSDEDRMRIQVDAQLSALGDSVNRLLQRAESQMKGQNPPDVRRNLSELPEKSTPLFIFVEFEACACTLHTEHTLAPAAAHTDDRIVRQAELEKLRMPLSQAMRDLEAAGAALAPGFALFAEQCCLRGASLNVLSRGFKDIIRHFLRAEGLGHVQVLANDLVVPASGGAWAPCFRDNTATGHDKRRSLKRAAGDGCTVLIGSAEDDGGVVRAGLVDLAYSVPETAFARSCRQAEIETRPFSSWEALAAELL
mmetsp:Transcript_22350/g.48785  ORF Transcript_22350/g.48785 Transcript_22350/m.48785 type:complete len:256 (+) Transcript_22350:201-968(+)